jgi:metallophosphoesterase (TIGR03767 family)
VHLSDLHVTDAQSPARAEFFDRLSDPDSPLLPELGLLDTYRPQESLTCQVVEAMVQAVRGCTAPVSGRAYDFAVATGDLTDNAQRNELDNYLALLDGGLVQPDSGDPDRWEGVGGTLGPYDRYYWHPDGPPAGKAADRPHVLFGFPNVPGLLDACRRPWGATGLDLSWYTVYGNHDALLAGTLAVNPLLQRLATGARKPTGWMVGADLSHLHGHDKTPPDIARVVAGGPWQQVSPDPARRFVTRQEWMTAHLTTNGNPAGHGISAAVVERSGVFYSFGAGPFRCLVLDTNNPHGGWQGSLSQSQVAWLKSELTNSAGSPVFLFSHHPLECLTNGYASTGEPRILADQVEQILAGYPNVLAWFAGHTHCNRIRPLTPDPRGHGLWQITTASHVDWPQEARVVEVLFDPKNEQLVLATTPLEHAAPIAPSPERLTDPVDLAAWSRELAFNNYQKRDRMRRESSRGTASDRCTALVLPLEGRGVSTALTRA